MHTTRNRNFATFFKSAHTAMEAANKACDLADVNSATAIKAGRKVPGHEIADAWVVSTLSMGKVRKFLVL